MRTTEILCGVSIPQSGLQAFRPVFNQGYPLDVVVSIPQSGLQAFRLGKLLCGLGSHNRFNPSIGLTSVPTGYSSISRSSSKVVSIPQSGLQAFRREVHYFLAAGILVSIPQSGFQTFRHVLLDESFDSTNMFQSLNRAYKRSDNNR